MAKAPAVVIIVRHGARLDAADNTWHLTSPTPYDPPLTYGGWVQSRALGLRIASLLHAREQELENGSTGLSPDSPRFDNAQSTAGAPDTNGAKGKGRSKRRKHKVFIHTSPFLRCVQTSIGIGAGLAQFQGLPAYSRKGSEARIKTVSQLHSSSPRLSAVDSPRLESIPEPLEKSMVDSTSRLTRDQHQQQQQQLEKPTLRIDAFLGEWLSPDYFESITHPPNSTMMVAGAKADLLRQSENIDVYTPTASKATGMWGTPPLTATHTASLAHLSGKRDRSNSSSSVASSTGRASNGRSSPFRLHSDAAFSKQDNAGYVPPVPTYAISPLDPIPRGYVAHAKDACINIDYQWDSMREPHYWGDGGSYGEEWSAMHKRFRRGLNNMIEWYSQDHESEKPKEHNDEDEDEEVDNVLILVTHGAGCNALIGALTNQPVLIDVGMASLTMAVRRDDAVFAAPASRLTTPPTAKTDPASRRRPLLRRNSTDLGLGNIYDLKIVASSEHLRPGVDPAQTAIRAPPSPMLASLKNLEYRRRFASSPHPTAGTPPEKNGSGSDSAGGPSTIAPSGMRRGSVAVARPERMRTYSLAAAAQVQSALEEMKVSTNSPTGLWSSPSMDKPPSPGQDFVLDFSNSPETSRPSTRPSSRPTSRPTSRGSSVTRLGTSHFDSMDVSPRHTPGMLTPAEEKAAQDEEAEVKKESESAVSDLPAVGSAVPHSLGRSLSQKGLWGSAPSGIVSRERGTPKRRWTLQQQE